MQANERFELLVASRSEHRKKDPPTYEGKFGEDIELWIFVRNNIMPKTFLEVIEIASNFEFAHYSGRARSQAQSSKSSMSTSDNRSSNAKSQKPNRSDKKKDKNDDWTKTATCKNCGKVGHISPQYKAPKSKEANRYISGALYAILEAEAQAFKEAGQERSVIIFIDNGCSLNGVSENLVKKLELEVNEGEMMQVDLRYDQVVHRPRRIVEINLQLPGFSLTSGTFQVMPMPENKDVILGMMWLREQNPDIDWGTGKVTPRINMEEVQDVQLKLTKQRAAKSVANQRAACIDQSREIFNYYRQHGHKGQYGTTQLITFQQMLKMLLYDKDIETVFVVNPHDSEKAERFKSQRWEALKDNPAYSTLRKYANTVFRTELPNETPPVREGIEHEILLKPGTKPVSVKQWRQSPEQRQTIQDCTKEMVQAGIIRPSTSAFSAPTFCVKKPVDWRIVHDHRQLNLATILPAIPMPRKEDIFDAMSGSHWFSCMDLYYQVKLCESDIPFAAFSTDGLFEYLVTPMGLSGSPGTFNRLLQKVFRDLRDVMKIYFDDIYVFTQSENVEDHIKALDRVLKRCEE
ncbi:unnamed protein product [Peronospora destructor]|uniref:Reverse transcriptase domain-containing protein n=1 Tax=Peronospora destructor TaxID=86335 RepID=A0AAV0V4A8_9STRA|nr:unnamed protein product [Peronospora destructor]